MQHICRLFVREEMIESPRVAVKAPITRTRASELRQIRRIPDLLWNIGTAVCVFTEFPFKHDP